MSKLGKFFKGGGSSKSRAAPSAQEALARLRETQEMLGKKQEYLEGRIQRELSLARKHGTQNKRGRHPAPARGGRVARRLARPFRELAVASGPPWERAERSAVLAGERGRRTRSPSDH